MNLIIAPVRAAFAGEASGFCSNPEDRRVLAYPNGHQMTIYRVIMVFPE